MKTSSKIIIGVLAVFFLAAVITPKFMFIEDSVSRKISMKMTGKTVTVKVRPFSKLNLFENYIETADKAYTVSDENYKQFEVEIEESDSVTVPEIVFDAIWNGNVKINSETEDELTIDFTMEKLLENYPAGSYDCLVGYKDKAILRIIVPRGMLLRVNGNRAFLRLLYFKDATLSIDTYGTNFVAVDSSFDLFFTREENDDEVVYEVDVDEMEEAVPVKK